MDPKTRQQLLLTVVIVCVIILALWWYRSPFGPGGKNKYGVIQVSWTSSASPATGDLVLGVDRSPGSELVGGKLLSFSPITVQVSSTVTSAQAQAIKSLLPQFAGAMITAIDAKSNTISCGEVPVPPGWPLPAASKSWSAPTTTGAKGKASGSVNILPGKGS